MSEPFPERDLEVASVCDVVWCGQAYRLVSAEVLRLVCDTAALRGKAAVNAPQSRRCARFEDAGQARQRLECGGFSNAFGR